MQSRAAARPSRSGPCDPTCPRTRTARKKTASVLPVRASGSFSIDDRDRSGADGDHGDAGTSALAISTRRGALVSSMSVLAALGGLGLPKAVLADEEGIVVFDETAMIEAEAEAEAAGAEAGAAGASSEASGASAAATNAGVSRITVQSSESASIDGQGSLSVLLSDDVSLAEDELSVTERQALQINRRTQKQNGVPPDFPLFARDGYNMTVLVSNGYQVTDDGGWY